MATPIEIGELIEAVDRSDTVIVEALPPEYFASGHLPGARNLPLDRVEELASQVAPDRARTVIAYCADEACPNSGVAAGRLEALGYTNVRTFSGGKAAWEQAGLPLEAGSDTHLEEV